MINKIKKIFIFIGMFLFILSFISCEKTTLTTYEKEKIDIAFENYLLSKNDGNISTFELKDFYGKYNGSLIILYKSEHISDEYRKDTINKIEFKYHPNEQIFVYANEKIYSLKEAYLNILIQSEELRNIKNKYDIKNNINEINCIEIDNEIILEEKIIFNENEHGGWQIVSIYIDKNFMHYQFTQETFEVNLPVREFIWVTENIYRACTEKSMEFPKSFRQLYVIKFVQEVKDEDLFRFIKQLESYDFVMQATTYYSSVG